MRKKAIENSTLSTIGAIILVLFVVFLYMRATGKSFGSFFSSTDQVQDSFIKDKLDKCREQTGHDYDKDGLPDFCDNCPLVDNNMAEDKDNDLFPKGCCGNDGKYNFLKEPKNGLVEGNFNEPGWCGGKAETDDPTQKHPVYNPAG